MKYKDLKLFLAIKKFKEEYLTSLKSQSDHTITSYSKSIELYLDFLNQDKNKEFRNIITADFNDQNILAYLDWLYEKRGNKNKTLNQRLSGVKSFCYFLKRENLMTHSDLALILEIKKRKEEIHKVAELTSEQLRHLLHLPNLSTKFGLRDSAYITLLYDSGCRNQEVLKLQLKDVEFIDNVSTLSVVGKGKKFRKIPISKEATSIIRKYIHSYHSTSESTEYLFYIERSGIRTSMSNDNGARIFKKYEKLSNQSGVVMPQLYPHLMRHQRALDLYRAGMPLELVSQWLGHAHLETSLIYAYADFEMKKKAIDKLVQNNSDIFNEEMFQYDEEEIIKKICGLK